MYYGGTFLIRSTAGKVPALKVQFPPVGVVAPLKETEELLTVLEIEMLKIKWSGKRGDWNLLGGVF